MHPMKLGKKPARRPAGLGDFKSYFATAPPPPPAAAHYGGRVTVPWQMDGNGPDPSVTIAPSGWQGCGDCVAACAAHALTAGNYQVGTTDPIPTPNAVVETYATLAGCTTAELFSDPSNYDTGLEIASTLQSWYTGTPELFGTRIGAYAPVSISDFDDLKNGIYLGGALVIGLQLPQSAEDQFPGAWSYVPDSPNLGGHCVLLTGYSAAGFSGVTWGQLITIGIVFLQHYLDEAWAIVSAQSVAAGTTPTGLDVAALTADLDQLD
jgi:ferredoxin